MWAAHDLADIEVYIADQNDNFPGWEQDLRGGAFLTAVRQYVRALQGKTSFKTAEGAFDDDEHQTRAYHDFVTTTASSPARPLAIYDSYRIVVLFRYGFYREALALGEDLMASLAELYSMRYIYFVMYYVSLCLIARLREEPDSSDRQSWLERVHEYRKKVRSISGASTANNSAWISILDAELADVNNDYNTAMAGYESAITQCMLVGSNLEEALAYELYAEYVWSKLSQA